MSRKICGGDGLAVLLFLPPARALSGNSPRGGAQRICLAGKSDDESYWNRNTARRSDAAGDPKTQATPARSFQAEPSSTDTRSHYDNRRDSQPPRHARYRRFDFEQWKMGIQLRYPADRRIQPVNRRRDRARADVLSSRNRESN